MSGKSVPLSKALRKLLCVIWGFSLLNFFVHLFPISLIQIFDIFPNDLTPALATDTVAFSSGSRARALAWFELSLGIAAQFLIAFALFLFTVFRETTRFAASGNARFLPGRSAYLGLAAALFSAAYLFPKFVLAGPGVFADLGLGPVSLAGLMLLLSVLAAATLSAMTLLTAHPRRARRFFADLGKCWPRQRI